MSRLVRQLKDKLGVVGLFAVGLLAASMLFQHAGLRPLEDKLARLDRALERARMPASPPNTRSAATPQIGLTQLGAFYRLLESDEGKPVWLARIHGIALSSGVELR